MLENQTISLIGGGAMGEAIISGLLRQKIVQPGQIFAAEPRAERRNELQSRYGVGVTGDNTEAVRAGQVVIFAIKPQMLSQVLPPLRGNLERGALCLSILAGVPIAVFVGGLEHAAVVRAMPNTPAQIGAGMTVWTASPDVTTQQQGWAQAILAALGEEQVVESEHELDMATAINGSGPAYVFLMLEAMVDAGVHLGFSRPMARRLVLQTMSGAVRYAIESGQHLAQLRNGVTSPAGTTAAALNALERGGLRATLSEAIWAAYHRSVELGKK